MEMFKRILAVSWSTKHCGKTIQYGISLARQYKADLFILHIFDTKWLQGFNVPMITVEKEHKKDMEKYKAELDSLIDAERQKGMNIKEFIEDGNSSDVILRLIKEQHIDLLILRTHEGTRLERMLIGGSNDDVVKAMPCSILIV